jgi:outer membrane protein
MTMIRLARLLALAGLAVFTAGTLSAQSKVGIISLQKALEGCSEVKVAQGELEARYKPRGERLAQLEKDIAKLNQDAETNQAKYTEAAMNDILMNIQRKQRDFDRQRQLLNDDVNRDRNELLQKFGTRMQDVIKKLAEEKGLDMVVDVTNLLYYKPALDLSAEATVAYDKAFPVKK